MRWYDTSAGGAALCGGAWASAIWGVSASLALPVEAAALLAASGLFLAALRGRAGLDHIATLPARVARAAEALSYADILVASLLSIALLVSVRLLLVPPAALAVGDAVSGLAAYSQQSLGALAPSVVAALGAAARWADSFAPTWQRESWARRRAYTSFAAGGGFGSFAYRDEAFREFAQRVKAEREAHERQWRQWNQWRQQHQQFGGRHRGSGHGGGRAPPHAGPSRSVLLEEARELLGVSTRATKQEIKAAFRELAREVHPDKAGSSSEGEGADAEEPNAKFIALRAAYELLLEETAK